MVDNKVDNFLEGAIKYITGTIATFVGFVFTVFAIGALFGLLLFTIKTAVAFLAITALAVLGLLAYASRGFTLLIFAALLFFVIFVL